MLLAATGEDLDRLCAAAARVRDAGLVAAGRPGVVTYSPKVFIPVTRLCRDRCHYCTFVTTPGHLERAGEAMFLSPDEILDLARRGRRAGLPRGAVHARRPSRGPLARGPGLARRAGLRLHAGLRPRDGDPGARGDRPAAAPQPRRDVVGGAEPAQAGRPVDGDDARDHLPAPVRGPGARPTTAPRTRTPRCGCGCSRTPAGSRCRSPPACSSASARTLTERAETIFALRATSRRFDAVQEVIVQNFRAKPDTAMRHADDLGLEEYRAAIAVTRLVLGPEGAGAGAAEPRRPRGVPRAARGGRRRLRRRLAAHPRPRQPRAPLAVAGAAARRSPPPAGSSSAPRLTVHPEYVRAGRALARPPALRPRRRARRRRRPRPPRRPPHGAALAGARRRLPAASGRTDLHAAIDTTGPHRRPAQRLRRRLRRLGRRARRPPATRPGDGAGRHRCRRPRPPARAAPPCGPRSATRAASPTSTRSR